MTKQIFKYGNFLADESQIFRFDLYKRIGVPKYFKNMKILDLGCGYGIDSKNFTKFSDNVVGSDIDEHPTWKIYSNKNLKFVKSKSEKLPFKDNEFDCVYLKDLLHHVGNVSKTLKEIRRVTKNNGTVVILEGNRYNPLFYIHATRLNGHEHFSKNELIRRIRSVFSNAKFLNHEAYPPYRFNKETYRIIIKIEKYIEKLSLFKNFFSYNVVVITNTK